MNKAQLDEVAADAGEANHYFAASGAQDGSDDAVANGTGALAAGAGSIANANGATAVGANSQAAKISASAFGSNANAAGTNATALGANTQALAATSSAIGSNAQARAAGSTAIGYEARVLDAATAGTAIGTRAQVTAINSVALGAGSVANRANTVSMGNVGSERQVTNVAAGTQDTDAVNVAQFNSALDDVDAGLAGAVKYDDDDKSTLTLEGEGGTTIGNVAAGALSATSTEAINGAQLFGMGDSVAQSFGGGASMGSNGFVGPVFSIQGGNYYNVGDALGALDGAISGIDSRLSAIETGTTDAATEHRAGDGQQQVAAGRWRQRGQPATTPLRPQPAAGSGDRIGHERHRRSAVAGPGRRRPTRPRWLRPRATPTPPRPRR